MAFTIYTVSDPATIGSALTSMAMFFGQDSWVGSALKTALLISLIAILFKGVTRDGLRLDVMLIQLLLVTMAFLPKTTVTVEQFDNSAPPRVIDDVPYAIAIPGSIAGAFALYMTQKIETVMASVNGDYISVTGDKSPFTPARMLMSFTACATDPMSCLDRNLVETMALAARYCGGSKLQGTNFSTVQSVLGEFAKGLTEPGLTVIYDESNPYQSGGNSGRAASCSEAAAHITSVAAGLAANNPGVFKTILETKTNNADIKRYSAQAQADTGEMKEWSQRLAEINMVTDSSRKIDTLAVANVMTISIAESLKYDATGAIDTAINMRRDLGLFEWAKTEAQQSMLVSSTAPKFMDVLFFIFIAATPIVMFVVAANPASGLKVAGSYALFGVWTQSWIPMMAIVMSWYQTEMMNFPAPSEFGHSAEYMAALMRHVNTSTIAAGNMIQNAPYMMFAIMTGSMFALSNMISKAVPSGSSGDPASAGGGQSSGGTGLPTPGGGGSSGSLGIPAQAQMASIMGAQAALAGGMASPAVGISGDAAANLPGLGEISVGAGVSSSLSGASEKASALRQQVQQQQSAALAQVATMLTSAGKMMSGGQMAQHLRNAGFSATYDASTGVMTSDLGTMKFNAGQTNQTSTGMGFDFQLAANTKDALWGKVGALSSGLSAQAAANARLGKQATQGVGLEEGRTLTTATDGRSGRGAGTQTGESGSTGTQGSVGAQWSKLASDAKQLTNTVQNITSQTKALDETDKMIRQGAEQTQSGSSATIRGSDFVQNWGSKAVTDNGRASVNSGEAGERIKQALGGSLVGGAMQQFDSLMSANQKKMYEQGLGRTLSHDQIAAAAAWKSLNQMASDKKAPADQRLDAMAATAKLAASAGMVDHSGNVNQAREALKQLASTEGSIAGMKAEVAPQVAAAISQVNTQLDPGKQDAHRAEVAGTIAKGKNESAGYYGRASTNAAQVEARGEEAVDKQRALVAAQVAGAKNPTPLTNEATDARNRMADLYVTPNDQNTFASGGNTSGSGAVSAALDRVIDSGKDTASGVLGLANDLFGKPANPDNSSGNTPPSQSPANVVDGAANLGIQTARSIAAETVAPAPQGSESGGHGASSPSPANVTEEASSLGVQTVRSIAAETTASAPQGGGGVAPAAPGGTGGPLPTTGEPIRFGGASANSGGGGNGGATPDGQGGQPMGSKPNSRVPSEGNGPGKKPSIPGRN